MAGELNEVNARRRKEKQERMQRCKELWAEGKTDPEIAKVLGISPYTTMIYRQEMHLRTNERKHHAYRERLKKNRSSRIKQVKAMIADGLSEEHICRQLGIAPRTLIQYRLAAGEYKRGPYNITNPHARGINNERVENPQRAIRTCLYCGSEFMSDGPSNRRCAPCRKVLNNAGPDMSIDVQAFPRGTGRAV